jgi:hypothetical protein
MAPNSACGYGYKEIRPKKKEKKEKIDRGFDVWVGPARRGKIWYGQIHCCGSGQVRKFFGADSVILLCSARET